MKKAFKIITEKLSTLGWIDLALWSVPVIIILLFTLSKPVAKKSFSSFQNEQHLQMNLDSMEFANKMAVWTK